MLQQKELKIFLQILKDDAEWAEKIMEDSDFIDTLQDLILNSEK